MDNKDSPLIIIEPKKGWIPVDIKEILRFRELLFFLAWRDVKLRYKQTLLGASWAIIQPFFTMVVFSLFFGKIAKIPSDGVPYPIFSYSGLILWIYFTNSISFAGISMVSSSNLISKVYFPRLIVPTSATLFGLVDYIMAFIVMVMMMVYYRFTPGITILILPVLLFMTWMLAAGVGYWLAALNVKYRDIGYIIPFFIQLWLFATPVIYPSSMVGGEYSWLLSLNPISGIIEAHRHAILGYTNINIFSLGISFILILLIFLSGMLYFKRVE
ncbi:MAG: ABC transporter permease, partial [Candidatus Methanoperedens sp.]|nr:ABC transporter permease [Candidatus Methanoperedens sp.]